MAWELVTEEEMANYARVKEEDLQDIWYDAALGAIEKHTAWKSLSAAQTVTEYVDGSGSAILRPKLPINSVTSIAIEGTNLPEAYYYVAWDGIQMRTYRPGESFSVTVWLDRVTQFGEVFPFGIKNIYLTYNYGGTSSLPDEYLQSIRMTLLMIIKELSIVPRSEGSDTMLRKYRPDRTLNPEEVLTTYGQHGKIKGILDAQLPRKTMWL